MFFQAATLDDLLRAAFSHIQEQGHPVGASRGANREARAVLLRLTNPRARLSHTATKSKAISALGELTWYLAGSNDVDFVSYYLKRYTKDAEENRTIHGAYGPRLFGEAWGGQFYNVFEALRTSATTRRAVIQLFDHRDILRRYKEIPCTCTLQFLVRGDPPRLHLITSMRSNDAFIGLPHDVFAFTMLQEIMARGLGIELGEYDHFAGSLHLYDEHTALANQFLGEGYQGRVDAAMPPMPLGNPWPSIKVVLDAEHALRTKQSLVEADIAALDGYWQDLVNLLRVLRCKKDGDHSRVPEIKNAMASQLFREYLAGFEKPE